MIIPISVKRQIWRRDELVASASAFRIDELFRLLRGFAGGLEVRKFADGVTQSYYLVGSPDDVARVFEARGPSHDGCTFLYLQAVEDLQGNDNIWSLEFHMSADGKVVGKFMQTLWNLAADEELMITEWSSEGVFLRAEKVFQPDESLDFLIYYDCESNIVDIVEFNLDYDHYLPEDLEPMFDDKVFYASALALPARFGPSAQAPDLPRLFVGRQRTAENPSGDA